MRWFGQRVEMHSFFSLAWMRLVNTFWDAFCVLACMGLVCRTNVEMHFVPSLARERFGQHLLPCILCPRFHWRILVNPSWAIFCVHAVMGSVWSTYVVIPLVCPQYMLKHSLRTFCVLSGIESRDAFQVFAGIKWDKSTQLEIQFVTFLALDKFGQHKLRSI
jgi:hypothetical protein